jgi:hypothetical protein
MILATESLPKSVRSDGANNVAARTVSVSADETHVVDSKGIFR